MTCRPARSETAVRYRSSVMVRQGWNRLRTAGPRSTTALVVDGALGAVFLVMTLVERLVVTPVPQARIPVAVALGTAIAAGLALRRRAPLTAYVLGSAAIAVEALIVAPGTLSPYANQIGVYSVGLYATRQRARWGLVVMLAGVVAYFAAVDELNRTAPAGVLLVWLLAWAIGYSGARRREEQRAARRLMRQQGVADERARIARELHDLIGHTVNVMLVQAGAGRRMLDRDPEKTRELLAGLEQTGRDALTELDRVLGVLRRDSPGADHADSPEGAPGLVDLPELALRMAQAGIRVSVHIDPELSQLPRSLDLSAYRIIQEALTNALKHGDAVSASVTVRHDARALEIEVGDDGRGAPLGYVPGRGLLGIGERVALFGGSVEHGAGEPGGFRLRAVLPLPGRPTE